MESLNDSLTSEVLNPHGGLYIGLGVWFLPMDNKYWGYSHSRESDNTRGFHFHPAGYTSD